MISYQEFITKYVGTKQDFDRNNDVQCVDYARLYVEQVWGMTSSYFGDIGGAVDAYTDYPSSLINGRSDLVQLIKNSPDNAPQQGDIVVFNRNMGVIKGVGYGHIAIVNSATLDQVYVTEQNKFGNNDAIMWGQYGYENVLGWLRKKEPVKPIDVPINGETIGEKFEKSWKKAMNNNRFMNAPFNGNATLTNAFLQTFDIDYIAGEMISRHELFNAMADLAKNANVIMAQSKTDYKILQDKYEAIKADRNGAITSLEATQKDYIQTLKIAADNLTAAQEQIKDLNWQLAQAPTSTSKKWYQSKKFMSTIIIGVLPLLIGFLVPEFQAQANMLYNLAVPYLIAQGIVDTSQNIFKSK